MKVLSKFFNLIVLGAIVVLARPALALGASHFTLTPASGNYTTGATISVTLGVDTGTDKTVGMDILGNFDEAKLELVSISKITSPAYDYDDSADYFVPKIDNTAGTFEVHLNPKSSSSYDGVVAKGPLVTLNFKAISAGTATVTFNCQSGSVVETNILNENAEDVVVCSSNQSGSYTITGASTTTTTTTTTATTAETATELPKTGGIFSTLGLIIFGLASVSGAVLLRWL